jgi:hypothetical protein
VVLKDLGEYGPLSSRNFVRLNVDIFSEAIKFLFSRKSLMIFVPAAIVIIIVVLLLMVSQGAAWAPFMYPIF